MTTRIFLNAKHIFVRFTDWLYKTKDGDHLELINPNGEFDHEKTLQTYRDLAQQHGLRVTFSVKVPGEDAEYSVYLNDGEIKIEMFRDDEQACKHAESNPQIEKILNCDTMHQVWPIEEVRPKID